MSKDFTEEPIAIDTTLSEHDYSDGIMSGAVIADEMLKGVPGCLRVRLAVDAISSVVSEDELETIETLLKNYLDEAVELETVFDWDNI